VVTVARCDVCGNDYDKAFQVSTADGQTRTFDSFECAIHAVAPTCAHCGCKIIGHGVESGGTMYCCAHCAQAMGREGFRDRVEAGTTTGAGTEGIAPTRPPSDE
jgi:hypothetical protein